MSVFANRYRGMARFDTICQITGLQNRLVFNLAELQQRKLTEQPLDFEMVDASLKPMKDFSMSWLTNALEKPKSPVSVRELQLWKCLEHDRRFHQDETEMAALKKQVNELTEQVKQLREGQRGKGSASNPGIIRRFADSVRTNGWKYTFKLCAKKLKQKFQK